MLAISEKVPPGRQSQLIHRRAIDLKDFIYRSVEKHLLESCIQSSPNAFVGFRACGQAVFTNTFLRLLIRGGYHSTKLTDTWAVFLNKNYKFTP